MTSFRKPITTCLAAVSRDECMNLVTRRVMAAASAVAAADVVVTVAIDAAAAAAVVTNVADTCSS